MLTAIKDLLRLMLAPMLYFVSIITAIVAIFKRAEWGLFFMVTMIPQPNVWYKLHQYPFGKDFMDILFFSILMGIIYQKKGFAKTSNTTVIIAFVIVSYLALWNSSIRFSLPLPLTRANILLPDWKNYAEMIFMYFLAINVIKDEDQQKLIVTIMSIIILFIAIRSYRNFTGGDSFSYDKRDGGPFEVLRLGANHFGAFIVHYCAFLFGLFLLDKNKKRKWLFLATVLFGLHPILFSYSRGAYLATLGVLIFFGLVKKKSLLVVVFVLLLVWQTILPASVVDRVMTTEDESGQLESSAASRLNLWKQATDLFKRNPIFGVGFGGFGLSVSGEQLLTDTHNFYLKTLSEQGIIGFVFLLIIIMKAFFSGWLLHKTGKTPFNKGLGLGFMGTVIAVMTTNMFGDRWSYFALGSYFWILWGLVDRGILISQRANHINESPALN
jgi:O-antigen ligase